VLLEIKAENPYDPVCMTLTSELVAELSPLYSDDPDDKTLDDFSPADVSVPRSVFLLAWLDGEAVGCGALRPMDDDTVEIKRMYVRPAARGKGISRKIVRALESYAQDFAYRKIRLGTGNRQPEAMRLYAASGYNRVVCAEPYLEDDHSVCFEKMLRS
jgi:putative acetyltransferase